MISGETVRNGVVRETVHDRHHQLIEKDHVDQRVVEGTQKIGDHRVVLHVLVIFQDVNRAEVEIYQEKGLTGESEVVVVIGTSSKSLIRFVFILNST